MEGIDWTRTFYAWCAYTVMAGIGGISGHVLAWERIRELYPEKPEWTASEHLKRVAATLIKACFLALSVFFGCQIYLQVLPPLCFVLTGFGSVFASETLHLVYDKGKQYLFRENGNAPRRNGTNGTNGTNSVRPP